MNINYEELLNELLKQLDRTKEEHMIVKQLEHIVNYEYNFYDTKEELINDLRTILNGGVVFEEISEEE